MKKISYLLACLLLSLLFFGGEASAKEEKTCKITHNITSKEVESITDIGPVKNEKGETIEHAVKVIIRVKGTYAIQHKDDATPGPTQTLNAPVPYIAPNQTKATIPAGIVEAYRELAAEDTKKKLNDGLKKACESHGCNNE